jgi:hypothetical protein
MLATGAMPHNRAVHIVDLGDVVKIVGTAETIAAGYARRTGTCYGFTTPSTTGISVIGGATADRALNVGFDDGTSAWFDPALVTLIDVNAGQIATLGTKRLVRLPSGDWVDAPDRAPDTST